MKETPALVKQCPEISPIISWITFAAFNIPSMSFVHVSMNACSQRHIWCGVVDLQVTWYCTCNRRGEGVIGPGLRWTWHSLTFLTQAAKPASILFSWRWEQVTTLEWPTDCKREEYTYTMVMLYANSYLQKECKDSSAGDRSSHLCHQLGGCPPLLRPLVMEEPAPVAGYALVPDDRVQPGRLEGPAPRLSRHSTMRRS